ncbi:MAG: S8 family serine peptidase [Prevotellaceae bacterium]|jgi:gliding motility-associated-like protein|nr:S8 family serine peptidase [Prevotellaceae bacterium]
MKYLLTLLILSLPFVEGGAQYVAGAIHVKLTPEVEAQLQTRPLRAQAGNVVQTGIKTIDDLNVRYGATEWRRIFPPAGDYEAAHREFGLHLWYEIVLKPDADVTAAATGYGDAPAITLAAPVARIKRITNVPDETVTVDNRQQATSNDPYFSSQWHYHNTGQVGVADVDINLPEAWNTTRGSNNVIVSVVDGGIDAAHPDIAANYAGGRNFVGSGGVTAEDHGTHVGGTIAAVSNNNTGVAGIAGGSGVGDGVRLLSCQIFEEDNGVGGAQAIVWGADNGAVISQNSWGYEQKDAYNQSDRDAINYFIAKAGKKSDGSPRDNTPMVGGIVIFAAGNNGDDGNWYPGAWDEVVAVAAIGPTGKRAYYSNYGSWVDITAPGGDVRVSSRTVFSTLPGGEYGYMQGTSMACPHVSGVAALILSVYGSPSYTPAQLRARLLASVRPLEWDPALIPFMGTGLADASKAVGEYIPVTGVTVPDYDTVYANRTRTLQATVSPANASNKQVTWKSNNTSIATVNASGVVQGIASGDTKIIATTVDGGYTGVTNLHVKGVSVESISIYPDTVIITPGNSAGVYITILPPDATNKQVTWTVLNAGIAAVIPGAAVDSIRALQQIGETKAIATTVDGEFRDSVVVRVVRAVEGVRMESNRLKILAGSVTPMKAIIEPEDAYNKNVIWSSDKSSIASIDIEGNLIARAVGSATIKVYTEDGNFEAYCTVEVVENIYAPQGFSPNGDGVNDYFVCSLDNRDSYTLTVFDRSGQVHYRSSDYQNDWDGTASTGPHAGNKVPANTYFYSISAKNTGQATTGFVVVKY